MKVVIVCVLGLSITACGASVDAPSDASGAASGSGASGGGATGTSTSGTGTSGGASGTGATAGSGGGAQVCGGKQGTPCPADSWCDFPADDCGVADGTGLCVKRPVECNDPPPTKSVCGCDGSSYADACHAELAGFDVHANATCTAPDLFACGDKQCKTGQEYCDVDNGFAVIYGCVPLPPSCLPPNAADCNCMPIAPDCGYCSDDGGHLVEGHGCG